MDTADLKRFNHKIDVEVRFMDLDVLHHVNNARYLNFLEESRLAYCKERLGLFTNIEELNIVVARIEIDFILPIHYGNRLSIHTRISKIGTKSFTFESVFTVSIEGKAQMVSRAYQTLVTIDLQNGKSIEIPGKYREKMESAEDQLS